jgi:predicted nucleic acid-binding protein
MTEETHERGLAIAERYALSIYDSMIVASALLSDCTLLISEDMQDQQVIEKKLTIRNPFRK